MNYKKSKVLNFKEGYSYPITNNVLIESDALYNQSQLNQDFDKLVFEKKEGLDMKLILIIGGVAIAVVVIIAILNKQPPPT